MAAPALLRERTDISSSCTPWTSPRRWNPAPRRDSLRRQWKDTSSRKWNWSAFTEGNDASSARWRPGTSPASLFSCGWDIQCTVLRNHTVGRGKSENAAERCLVFPNYGRICWSVAGTISETKVHCAVAEKIGDCRKCTFYEIVKPSCPS